MLRITVAVLLCFFCAAFARAQGLPNGGFSGDACASSAHSSTPVSITTAITTQLIPASTSMTISVCALALTIAPSATSADTALFEYGQGTACASTPVTLTGTFGNGDLTSAAPVTVLTYGNGLATLFRTAANNALCLLTAGTAVNVQGVITYVKQ